MRTEEPRAVRLKDYRPPDYRVREIALDFRSIRRHARHDPFAGRAGRRDDAVPLMLDGESLKLLSITLDGRALGHKRISDRTR